MSHDSIVAALTAVMAQVGAVKKDSTNSQQGFKFRGVDAVVNAVQPALIKHGVVVTPHVQHIEYHDIATTAGGNATSVRVVVEYMFQTADDVLTAIVAAEAFDVGDKATAKAMSVAFRTVLLQVLALPTDEKQDPDHE